MAPTKSALKKSSSKASAPTPKTAPASKPVKAKETAPPAESSTKPAKTLKRKKGVDPEPEAETVSPEKDEAEAPKSPKKAKKEKDVAAVKVKEVVEEKPKKSAKGKETKEAKETKSKAAPTATASPEPEAAPAKKSKSSTKKATEPVPTSISRPRNVDTKAKSKKSKKAKSPSPVEEDEEEASDEDVAAAEEKGEDEEQEESHLHGFSTDDDDSSDEEDDGMDVEVDLGKLPTIAKDDATVKRKLEKAKQNPGEDRGVLFLGRLPHGFYEDQLKAYFSQFGTVTRLRVSRNKKTGKSKHYGFIEFDSSAVAQIVADTMDNYLLMGHILRCKVIPKDEVHPELWVGANRKWRVVPKDRVARAEHDKPRTDAEKARANKRLLKRQAERKAKLANAGIDYDFDAVAYKTPATAAIKV
ncbi:hypothetical protein D9619_004325 [Psilocybe cf. subviscida]|uniref:RRM domain-containing protein n=1 Tax=Psilocybe cf. subviscida TaxID=2480587 RepID=A0A8H5BQF2_9AGAR|nr:hypothetical protein D9619_004325 [Psilocybe cf. subviscida]